MDVAGRVKYAFALEELVFFSAYKWPTQTEKSAPRFHTNEAHTQEIHIWTPYNHFSHISACDKSIHS